MMERSFGFFFFLKQAKSMKDGTRYVYLRITVNGRSNEVSAKRLWHQDRWDSKAGRAIDR
jgi:hypothetical protein